MHNTLFITHNTQHAHYAIYHNMQQCFFFVCATQQSASLCLNCERFIWLRLIVVLAKIDIIGRWLSTIVRWAIVIIIIFFWFSNIDCSTCDVCNCFVLDLNVTVDTLPTSNQCCFVDCWFFSLSHRSIFDGHRDAVFIF